jgi:hypothetical protein
MLSKILFFCLILIPALVSAQEYSSESATITIIDVLPKQCVALNKGQVCYQTVTLKWEANTVADYCVHSSQDIEPLACWQNQREGMLTREIASQDSVVFSLNKSPSNEKLADVTMRVAWVYEQKRRKIIAWRLF